MKYLLILLILFVAMGCEKKTTSILVEFRLVDEKPTQEGITGTKDRRSGKIVYPRSQVILNQNDIQSAEVELHFEDDFGVMATLTSEADKKWEKFTSEHLYQRIGIFIDNELVCTPVIIDTMDYGKFLILGNFSKKEAQNIADRLNRWR